MKQCVSLSLFILLLGRLTAGAEPAPAANYLLRPAAVFDGTELHQDWVVLVQGERITQAGPAADVKPPNDTTTIALPNDTLTPGLIEGHSHLFLHPYNETPWNDQVLTESLAFRTAEATAHARATLLAGFTTTRDLGTEGAGYGDVGLKKAIDRGIIPGPRMIVVTRAIVAAGSYGPKLSPELDLPQGAQEASGIDDIVRVTREQIGKGADWVKLYADYRWGAGEHSRPTFSQEELAAAVRAAHDAGPSRRRARDHGRGHAPRHPRRRRYGRARRRRDRGGV